MATVKIEAASEKNPHTCKGRKPPVRNGIYYEFQDATEVELAFWNVLSDDERRKLSREAYKRCFFEVLGEVMKNEAEKSRKWQKRI